MREDLEKKIQEAAKRSSKSGESALTRQSGAADSLEDAGASAMAAASKATALAEPVSSIALALAEPGASTSSSGHDRGQKRDRAQIDEEPLGEKHEEDKPSGLEGLERDQVREAIASAAEGKGKGGNVNVGDPNLLKKFLKPGSVWNNQPQAKGSAESKVKSGCRLAVGQ